MKIVAFLNEKGGVGKTSLAVNTATALHRAGKKVVIVDTDEQGSASDWREANQEDATLPPVIRMLQADKLKTMKSLDADIVIVDTPARASSMTTKVITLADTAVIVIQPSAADIWAAAAIVKLVQDKLDIGGTIDACFVANRISNVTKISKEVLSGDWNEYNIQLLKSTIGNRTAFATAIADGKSIFDTSDTTGKREVEALVSELQEKHWI